MTHTKIYVAKKIYHIFKITPQILKFKEMDKNCMICPSVHVAVVPKLIKSTLITSSEAFEAIRSPSIYEKGPRRTQLLRKVSIFLTVRLVETVLTV